MVDIVLYVNILVDIKFIFVVDAVSCAHVIVDATTLDVIASLPSNSE